jgi:hypothetical protein
MDDQHVASGVPEGHSAAEDEEPKTPMWLPALGAALFVGVALLWAVTPPVTSFSAAEPAAASTASAGAPNPQAQVVPPPTPAAAQQGPAASARPGRPPTMPSALPADLQKRLNDFRGKQH